MDTPVVPEQPPPSEAGNNIPQNIRKILRPNQGTLLVIFLGVIALLVLGMLFILSQGSHWSQFPQGRLGDAIRLVAPILLFIVLSSAIAASFYFGRAKRPQNQIYWGLVLGGLYLLLSWLIDEFSLVNVHSSSGFLLFPLLFMALLGPIFIGIGIGRLLFPSKAENSGVE